MSFIDNLFKKSDGSPTKFGNVIGTVMKVEGKLAAVAGTAFGVPGADQIGAAYSGVGTMLKTPTTTGPALGRTYQVSSPVSGSSSGSLGYIAPLATSDGIPILPQGTPGVAPAGGLNLTTLAIIGGVAYLLFKKK